MYPMYRSPHVPYTVYTIMRRHRVCIIYPLLHLCPLLHRAHFCTVHCSAINATLVAEAIDFLAGKSRVAIYSGAMAIFNIQSSASHSH